jgi:hypothetical protein
MASRKENFARAVAAWEEVKHLHPKIRTAQDSLVALVMRGSADSSIGIAPADIRFGWFRHLVHSDYRAFLNGPSDEIVIDGCYTRDFDRCRGKLTLAEYVINRVAVAEGLRTVHYQNSPVGALDSFDWYADVPARRDEYGADMLASWLGYQSVKAVGANPMFFTPNYPFIDVTLSMVDSALSDGKTLRNGLRDPSDVFVAVREQWHKPVSPA